MSVGRNVDVLGRPAPDPLVSPCVRLCTLNEADICLGCGRSIEEICGWSNMSTEQRQAVLQNAGERRRAFPRWE